MLVVCGGPTGVVRVAGGTCEDSDCGCRRVEARNCIGASCDIMLGLETTTEGSVVVCGGGIAAEAIGD
jgi:hypothetical protein